VTIVVVALIAGLGLAALLGLHRMAVWAEGRGWIYYRTRPRSPVGLGLLAEIYAPEMEHVIEERTSEAARRTADEEGAPPT
jgi:hypothetical protein